MTVLGELNSGLCDFIQDSPTPFHAVKNLCQQLHEAGYRRLYEADSWELEAGQKYFVCRNDSSLIAFRTGSGDVLNQGFNIIGAHTDSPCLKVKPQGAQISNTYGQLGVEVYGGVLLNPWFDRDLSLAGRVSYQTGGGDIKACLLDMERPVACIPSLAIHLDREANKSRSINEQKHLPPILAQLQDKKSFDFDALLLSCLRDTLGLGDAEKVLSHELCFYDTQKPALVGFNGDFIAGARLDNLLSCYIGLRALLASDESVPALLVCTDHEEVGSVSAAGAAGSFMEAILERVAESQTEGKQQEAKRRLLSQSMLVSTDNAHGIHPNFSDKHDQQHGPLLNDGPVLKINANQRYASNSETLAHFKAVCQKKNVPLQSFVVRTDMACGSTIGPIMAAELGIKTLDIGVPTFAMHSIRELAGARDTQFLLDALSGFLDRV